MKGKIIFRSISIFSILFGLALLSSIKLNPIGAVIGVQNIHPTPIIEFGIFFLLTGMILLVINITSNKNKSQ